MQPDIIFFDAGGTLLHLDNRTIATLCFDAASLPDDDALLCAEHSARLVLDAMFRAGTLDANVL